MPLYPAPAAVVNLGRPAAPTFTEVLPATPSSKHSGFRWTPDPARPGSGRLVIDTDRVRLCYRVSEFGTPWAGRALRLAKEAAAGDPEGESYDVFVSRIGSGHRCDCNGFAYGRGKPC